MKYPLGALTAVRLETHEQFSQRVTATRLATMGVFALAAKKSKSHTLAYAVAHFHLHSGDQELTIRTDKAAALVSALQAAMPPKPESSEHSSAGETTATAPDIPAQILALAEVRDKGALTEGEFMCPPLYREIIHGATRQQT
jgi:hypothetical protein